MSVSYDKDKKAYRFQFKRIIDGKRYRSSKLLPAAWTQAQADAFDRQESARLYAQTTGVTKPKPLIDEAIQLYLDFHITNKKSKKTAMESLACLIPYVKGRCLDELGNISKKFTREHSHVKDATVRHRLAYLKAAVKYAYKHHDLGDRDYTEKMLIPSANDERHIYLKQEDVSRLIDACEDEETKAIILLTFYTGLRWQAEILTLKPESIIYINNQAWLSILDTKNGRPHMIPVHPDAMPALEFIPFSFSRSYYYSKFWAARKAAGMPLVRFHDQRHSFASALLSNGSTLAEVAVALNHQSTRSTSRYAHLYPEKVLDMVLRLPVAKKATP